MLQEYLHRLYCTDAFFTKLNHLLTVHFTELNHLLTFQKCFELFVHEHR